MNIDGETLGRCGDGRARTARHRSRRARRLTSATGKAPSAGTAPWFHHRCLSPPNPIDVLVPAGTSLSDVGSRVW